ncbi:MAG: hypothetical protein ACFE9L_10645 [Candidatus Hodarchaeota archaeon]
MWEYKIIQLQQSEFEELSNLVNQIKHKISDEFKQKFPDWSTEKGTISEDEREKTLEEHYYNPMQQRIRKISPSVTFEDKPDKYRFKQMDYFESKLNELGRDG